MKRFAFLTGLVLGMLVLAAPAAVPAANSFAGVWTCTASGEGPNGDQTGHFSLVTTQSGQTVTGNYYKGSASLQGTQSGNTLTGTFHEPDGSGLFTFVMSDDGNSFTGTWGVKAGQTGGSWNGTRQ